LGLVEDGEALLLPVELGDVGERLLLVDDLHGAGVDGLLQAEDLLVDLVDGLGGDLAAGDLLLGDAGLEGLVQALHLVHDLAAGRLARLLLGADLAKLGAELLLALGRGRVLVVRAGVVELGLDVPL
jgi:hypothetical protein